MIHQCPPQGLLTFKTLLPALLLYISSPLQQRQFDDFVERIIHPAGLIMFSDVTVRSDIQNVTTVYEPIIAGPVVPILSPDSYNVKYTAFAVTPAKTEGINDAIGPNMGTTEENEGVQQLGHISQGQVNASIAQHKVEFGKDYGDDSEDQIGVYTDVTLLGGTPRSQAR